MLLYASVAQLVVRNLAKVEVTGSNPVTRSIYLCFHLILSERSVCFLPALKLNNKYVAGISSTKMIKRIVSINGF